MSDKIKRTFEQVRNEFLERGYELISSEYNGERDYVEYICPKHRDKGIQKIRCSNFHGGAGCYYCRQEKAGKSRIKMSFEEVKAEFTARGYELVSTEYNGMRDKLKYICPIHRDKGIQTVTFTNFHYLGNHCYYCGRKIHADACIKKNYEQVKKEFSDKGYELISSEYKGVMKKLDYICIKHRDKGVQHTTYSRLQRSGCKYCGIEKSKQANLLTLEEFQEKISSKNKNAIVLKYNGYTSKSTFQCKKCGYVWESSTHTMRAYGKRCPNCENISKGEEKVLQILDEWGIRSESQYKFKDCCDVRPLPFDYYLPDDNICIEYDGEQHFREFPGWTNYEKTKYHDGIKNKYCADNGIILIRIPYWEEDDMEYYLFNALSDCGVIQETANID